MKQLISYLFALVLCSGLASLILSACSGALRQILLGDESESVFN